MTSAPVKNTTPLMNYVKSTQTPSAPDDLAGSFTDAFSKASGQGSMQDMTFTDNRTVQNAAQMKDNSSSVKKAPEKNNTAKKTHADSAKTDKTEMGKDTEAAVDKAGEALVKKVADELGVSVEKVQEAMQELGITMADLLNADQMTQLVLNLEGADILSLVTDEGLYQSLQNLLGEASQTMQALQKELGLTKEELMAALEQAKAAADASKQEMAGKPTAGEDKTTLPDGQKDYTVTVEQNGENVKISVQKDAAGKTESTESSIEEIPVAKTGEEEKKAGTKEETSHNDPSSQNRNTQTTTLLESLLNRENPVKTDAAFDTAMTQRTADTRNIMNQIMDYMRVQVKADTTQMEIQLHPASLGTVNVNITAKAGVITAQFLTQNEAVKAAVESQIVQLKNSFEEQGLKVEAVEVAVDSRQFDRSLNGNENGQDQEKDSRKKGTRKINLNDLNAEEEAQLDDAEQIAVAMMTSGGNTVDYTA